MGPGAASRWSPVLAGGLPVCKTKTYRTQVIKMRSRCDRQRWRQRLPLLPLRLLLLRLLLCRTPQASCEQRL